MDEYVVYQEVRQTIQAYAQTDEKKRAKTIRSAKIYADNTRCCEKEEEEVIVLKNPLSMWPVVVPVQEP